MPSAKERQTTRQGKEANKEQQKGIDRVAPCNVRSRGLITCEDINRILYSVPETLMCLLPEP